MKIEATPTPRSVAPSSPASASPSSASSSSVPFSAVVTVTERENLRRLDEIFGVKSNPQRNLELLRRFGDISRVVETIFAQGGGGGDAPAPLSSSSSLSSSAASF